MIGFSFGSYIMMQLGSFQFGITTAAYQELSRSTEYVWAEQTKFGKRPTLQFTGPGQDTISLPGVIYPSYRGGFTQVSSLRSLAAQGVPQFLISGTGAMMGRWVIERVEEKQSSFAGLGLPKKQEFTLSLKRFD